MSSNSPKNMCKMYNSMNTNSKQFEELKTSIDTYNRENSDEYKIVRRLVDKWSNIFGNYEK